MTCATSAQRLIPAAKLGRLRLEPPAEFNKITSRARRGAPACGLANVDVREGEATALPIDAESVDSFVTSA
jgi:hypothetical protein